MTGDVPPILWALAIIGAVIYVGAYLVTETRRRSKRGRAAHCTTCGRHLTYVIFEPDAAEYNPLTGTRDFRHISIWCCSRGPGHANWPKLDGWHPVRRAGQVIERSRPS